ncbi:MAG TPA: hypothetical protein VJ870_01545 [Amycolatopsis sp.]|nr:hypothetical protein [Amycolatopsis sp.]
MTGLNDPSLVDSLRAQLAGMSIMPGQAGYTTGRDVPADFYEQRFRDVLAAHESDPEPADSAPPQEKAGGYVDPSQGHGNAEPSDGRPDTFAEQLAAALSGQRDRAVGPSFWGVRG